MTAPRSAPMPASPTPRSPSPSLPAWCGSTASDGAAAEASKTASTATPRLQRRARPARRRRRHRPSESRRSARRSNARHDPRIAAGPQSPITPARMSRASSAATAPAPALLLALLLLMPLPAARCPGPVGPRGAGRARHPGRGEHPCPACRRCRPANLYSEAAANRLSAAVAEALPRVYVPDVGSGRRHGDRPRHLDRGRPLPRRAQPAARHARLGPRHALGGEQRRPAAARAAGWCRSTPRPASRASRSKWTTPTTSGHPRRALGHRRGRDRSGAWSSAIHPLALQRAADAELSRHQPCRLRHRRALCHLHLRVRRRAGQDRPRRRQRRRHAQALQGGMPPGHPHRAGRQGLLCRRHDGRRRVRARRRRLRRDRLHPDRHRHPRGSIPTATGASSTSPIAAPTRSAARRMAAAASRSSTSAQGRWIRPGPSPAAAAWTWAMSAPTRRTLWLSAASTTSSMPSTPRAARCAASRVGHTPTVSPSGPSPDAYSLGHAGNMR